MFFARPLWHSLAFWAIRKIMQPFINNYYKTTEMKTMTCKQLGGACELAFQANSFEEIADLSKQHGMEML